MGNIWEESIADGVSVDGQYGHYLATTTMIMMCVSGAQKKRQEKENEGSLLLAWSRSNLQCWCGD
jgi:hypothetical protein